MASFAPTRRRLIGSGLAALATLALAPRQAFASLERIGFDDLYGKISVLGLSFSDKAKALAGQSVEMQGFMAPPLKAEAKFFVLTEIPMSLCPFCSSDADWPANIVVVYLKEAQTFEQANKTIEVSGRFEIGSWTDPETGFVSLVRIVDSRFRTV